MFSGNYSKREITNQYLVNVMSHIYATNNLTSKDHRSKY